MSLGVLYVESPALWGLKEGRELKHLGKEPWNHLGTGTSSTLIGMFLYSNF